jgi:hypothetical protein
MGTVSKTQLRPQTQNCGRRGESMVRLLAIRAFPGSLTHKVFCRPLNLVESGCLSGDVLAGFLLNTTLASENGIMVSAVTVRGGETLGEVRKFPFVGLRVHAELWRLSESFSVSAYAQREGYTVAGTIQKPGIALSKA